MEEVAQEWTWRGIFMRSFLVRKTMPVTVTPPLVDFAVPYLDNRRMDNGVMVTPLGQDTLIPTASTKLTPLR
jgi:hypothetical protein